MDEILNKYPLLKDHNVSRETLLEFESFIGMLKKKMKKLTSLAKKQLKMQ